LFVNEGLPPAVDHVSPPSAVNSSVPWFVMAAAYDCSMVRPDQERGELRARAVEDGAAAV